MAAAYIGDAVEESIRLAETLAQIGGTAHRWPLLEFAKNMQLMLAPEVELLVDADNDAQSATVRTPYAEMSAVGRISDFVRWP